MLTNKEEIDKLKERFNRLEQKVSNPEWLDVLILDLINTEFVKLIEVFEHNAEEIVKLYDVVISQKREIDELSKLILKSTHIDTFCEDMKEVDRQFRELKEDITNVADSSGNFEDMLLSKVNKLKDTLQKFLREFENSHDDSIHRDFFTKLLEELKL